MLLSEHTCIQIKTDIQTISSFQKDLPGTVNNVKLSKPSFNDAQAHTCCDCRVFVCTYMNQHVSLPRQPVIFSGKDLGLKSPHHDIYTPVN